ncbi:MAG: acyl-CoA dehydrogenase [Planctomycetota bacterium]|nr:acyl-CoA dehydrogenase [Planctomycetota bacterium]
MAEPTPDWSFPAGSGDEPERLQDLATRLASEDLVADMAGVWPERLWGILAEFGATRWAFPAVSGEAIDRSSLVRRYAKVAEGSLTAAFILTQHDAAIRRLFAASAPGKARAEERLERIAAGEVFPTVGISQLTTSRRHGTRAMVATETESGYRLDGAMPWVTAAERADLFVTGGVFDDGRQLLAAVPRDRPGLTVKPAFDLAALGASRTSEILCDGVLIDRDEVTAGPSMDVMATPGLAGTGGLETSALAVGQARAALVALAKEADHRDELAEPVASLAASWRAISSGLIAAAEGRADAPAPGLIRGEANDLVLRATQAYLTARKGSGFLRSEPAQLWARQALFFLVWSCPGPVANAAIRDLAGCST